MGIKPFVFLLHQSFTCFNVPEAPKSTEKDSASKVFSIWLQKAFFRDRSLATQVELASEKDTLGSAL